MLQVYFSRRRVIRIIRNGVAATNPYRLPCKFPVRRRQIVGLQIDIGLGTATTEVAKTKSAMSPGIPDGSERRSGANLWAQIRSAFTLRGQTGNHQAAAVRQPRGAALTAKADRRFSGVAARSKNDRCSIAHCGSTDPAQPHRSYARSASSSAGNFGDTIQIPGTGRPT